jgi:AcrR family transcriptional regulator
MRDVIAASGMSAGAVYHYYPAKSSLMEAIGDMIEERYSVATRAMAARPDTPDPAELIRTLTASMIPADGAPDLTAVGVAVWAEAIHDDVIAASTRRVFTALRAGLATIARRWRDDGRLPSDTDPDEVAAVLYGMMPGYVVQRLILGDVDPDSYARGLEALIGYRP